MTVQIVNRTDPVGGLELVFPMPEKGAGAFGSFLGHGSDNRKHWIKVLNNPPGQPKTLVAEYVAGRLGQLLGGPVCEVEPIWISADHAGYEFAPNCYLQEGWGNASLDVPSTVEIRSLEHRFSDDNQRRHVGIFATWDWCIGADPQWLYQSTSQNSTWAHDHGLFLWSGNFTGGAFAMQPDTPNICPSDPGGLDPATVVNTVAHLRAVTDGTLSTVLSAVPASWPVADAELQELGDFLLARAPKVADRLEALVAP